MKPEGIKNIWKEHIQNLLNADVHTEERIDEQVEQGKKSFGGNYAYPHKKDMGRREGHRRWGQ